MKMALRAGIYPVVVAAIVGVALSLASCGDVPVYRWNFGRPTSFAFTKSGLAPVDLSVPRTRPGADYNVSGSTPSRAVTTVDHIDYGIETGGMVEQTDIQAAREAAGTFLGTYTPDVFRIPMVKVGFLSTETGDGFWVLLSDEGIVGDTEFIDFINPVYITDDRLWEQMDYDLMFSGFRLGVWDIGGDPFTADIQVIAPGYTDTDMPDYFLGDKGHHRLYMGNNRFAVSGGELYSTAPVPVGIDTYTQPVQIFTYEPSLLLFRENISQPAVYFFNYREDERKYDELQDLLYNANKWREEQPLAPGYTESWVDLPFDGLHIGEDTQELVITVSWDLENIVELWDYGDAGLHFQLAADFMHRFSVNVQQIAER